MSTSAAPLPAVRAALAGLIDYAGLFPPAQLDMASALAEYMRARRSEFAWMLGRFIVPASRIAELRSAAAPGEPLPLSVILDLGWDANVLRRLVPADGVLEAQAFEMSLAPGDVDPLAAALRRSGLEEPLYVEWRREPGWRAELLAVMQRLANNGLRAKIRCGGASESAYPSPDELNAFVHAAAREKVPFKATAGLHHPIRHFNEAAGVTMHGFLNLLFAAVFAAGGMDEQTSLACLADEDPRHFTFDAVGLHWNGASASTPQIEAARRELFVSYGSCSFSEPVEDLQGLGLL